MSMPHHNGPDLAAEVSVLTGLVRQLLSIVKSDAERSQTIPEFCASERISRAFYYELQKQNRGPRTMHHADGCVRISPEARRDWRREREYETTQAKNEPMLEKVVLGPKAVGHTEHRLNKMIGQGIDEAAAECDHRPRANADKHATKATPAEAR
jgi:hypothetical protein